MKKLNYLTALLVMALLVACGSQQNITAADEQSTPFASDATFEVVSWNIENFPKSNQSTVNYVTAIMDSIGADLFAVQEIGDLNDFNTVAAGLPGYTAITNHDNFQALGYIYNTQTITVTGTDHLYTTNRYAFPRAPFVLDCTFNGLAYTIINNHFKAYDGEEERDRRLQASTLLQQWITANHPNDNVIVVGDMNDSITDPTDLNVFTPFLERPYNYMFADMEIALNPASNNISYPSYGSHLDHILITNELFDELELGQCLVIDAENWVGSWNMYDQYVSDHRPVGLSITPQD